MENRTSAEDKIDDIATGLYRRIEQETDGFLRGQLVILGVDPDEGIKDCEKMDYPDDPMVLCFYVYKGKPVLFIRVAVNKMGVEFLLPKIETQRGSE